LQSADYFSQIPLDDIEIVEQVRSELDDEYNSLVDLGRDLRKRQAQNIIVRPNKPGRPKPYLLVAGERRVRGALAEGLTELWALVAELTDEEAEELQMAENIHRKNLTQIEEAKRIQRDLDTLGSVDAVLAKHNKSRAWLSKIQSLLTLPDQTKRLVSEHISADMEVISTVRQVEKSDPAAAKKLVERLKTGKGKEDARKAASETLKQVKPPKKTPESKPTSKPAALPSPAVFAEAKFETPPAFSPESALNALYDALQLPGATAKKAINRLAAADRTEVGAWLYTFYDSGTQALTSAANRGETLSRAVLQGFADQQFASTGAGSLALVAFLYGTGGDKEYDLSNVLSAAITTR